ncbi:MAG: class F sortase [Acidimicrobiia bacterium]|nr:class F sortase [Acidimicrobiia bacterium]
MRRIIGIGAIGLGIALVVVAVLALLNENRSSGDVAAVEDALRPSTTVENPIAATTAPPTTLPAPDPDGQAGEEEPPTQPEPEPISVPIGLRIDELEVDAPIGSYGVNQRTGEMDVPDNVTEVGWYRFGPKPGEAGSAVLAAHVDLASSGPGVFYDLQTLEEGDRMSVLYEDGSETQFRVVARVTYEKDELPLDVIFSREGPSVLTLITCGGAFNSNISRYDSNVVVYAVPDTGSELPAGSSL